MFHCLAL
uniref:Uncharacterized protein n=1 Tax=Macrostomum lignano TaxID=282301 RepID=A0A1Y9ET89_9PLAT